MIKKCFFAIFLWVGILHAAGTPSGTQISFYPVLLSTTSGNYTITANLYVTVTAIHGITLNPLVIKQQSATLTDFYLPYQLKSTSNIVESVLLNSNQMGAGWTAQMLLDQNGDQVHQPSETTVLSFPYSLPADNRLNFFVRLIPPVGLNISSQSTYNFQFQITSDGGSYTGFNGIRYGAADLVSGLAAAQITLSPFSDHTPPYVISLDPAALATRVKELVDVKFVLGDTESGVKFNTVAMQINGKWVTPSLSGTPAELAAATAQNFENLITVNITLYAKDNSGNALVYPYSFTVNSIKSWKITQALAVPTCFNPEVETTDLIYMLPNDEDVTVKVFDLSGSAVWSHYYWRGTPGGQKGNNLVTWDGKDKMKQIQSNGVYFYYVVSDTDNKPKANGKMVISKGGCKRLY